MSSSARLLRLLVVATAAAACSGGPSHPTVAPREPTSQVGGADAATAGAAAGATWGLDTRPANATCKAFARPAAGGTLKRTRVFPKLKLPLPVAFLQAPGDATRFFVVEKAGLVVSFAASDDAATATTTVLDITGRVDARKKEAGLLGIAFHPRFAENGQVFLSYTAAGSGDVALRSRISRFTSKDGGKTLDPATEQVLIEVDRAVTYRLGGDLAFGPDGFLYASLGDASREDKPDGAAQDPTSLRGKILRLDVDAPVDSLAYGIPSDNPFARDKSGKRPEIFAWGFRNIWRMSFDADTGELWGGDVGGKRFEEIDRIVRGGNYGFDVREGLVCVKGTTCAEHGLIAPEVVYPHKSGNTVIGLAVVGGGVYRGKAIPALAGVYVYSDFASGTVWGLYHDAGGAAAPRVLLASGLAVSAFGRDAAGELYILDYGAGAVYRLDADSTAAAAAGAADPVPATLSATGCVDPADATRPAAGLIPFDVAAPLWSDGADKARWLALPDGTSITVGADGDFELPVGAVVMKSFAIGGKLVETRLLVRHADGDFAGYSYAWDADGRDARLLPAGATRDLGGGRSWTFPARDQCLQCHTTAAGRTLGLEAAQLDFAIDYPGGRTANQLATLVHLGMLAEPPAPSAASPRFPRVTDDSQPLADRARAYLHANCAHCHRPGGPGNGSADLRFATAFADAALCNAPPQAGDLGIAGAQLIVPGDPAKSILSFRLRATDARRMPPLATQVIDERGTALVDKWITSLHACE